MVDWKSEAGLYNRLPRPRFLTDGSENHWHIEINRIEENTGRIHFTQKCSAAVQFQSRAIVELPEEGSIELAKVVVDRLIYNFLFPGKRIASGVRSNRVLISGRFAPYILETRTAEFAACLGQVMEEVGIKKLPHIVIEPQDDIAGQNLQADAETACTTMDDPQSTDIDIEAGLSMFDDPESTKADIEASFSIFDDPQNTEVDIEAEVSMVVSPHGTEVDVEASFPMFDNAQGTEVGVEASFAIFDNTQSHSPMWLPRRSHAANPTASYSSRAGRIPEGLRTTIQELFGCTPDDPMFSTKALGTDDVTISLSQKLSKSPDFLEELFVSPRFRGACAKILDPSENGVNDKIWDLGAFPILLMLLRPPKRGLLHKSAHKSNQRQAPKQPMTIESSSKAAPGSWPETSGEELGDSPEQSRETGETSSSKPDPGPEISRKSKAREPPTVKVERPSLTQHEPTPIPTNCTVCKSASTPEELELFPCRYCQRIWYCSRVCLRFEAATHSGVCFKRVPPRRRREGTEKRPEVASKESPKDPNREDLSGKDPSGEPPSGEGSNEEEPHRHSPNEEHLNMEELDDHHTSSDALREESPTGKERGKKKPKEGAPDYQCKHLRGPTRVCQSCKKREATLKRPLKLCRCKKVFYCSRRCQRRDREQHGRKCRRRLFTSLDMYCCPELSAVNKFYTENAPVDPAARKLARKMPGLRNFGKKDPEFSKCKAFLPPLWELIGAGLDTPESFETFFGPSWPTIARQHRENRIAILHRHECFVKMHTDGAGIYKLQKKLRLRPASEVEKRDLQEIQSIKEKMMPCEDLGLIQVFRIHDMQEIVFAYGDDWVLAAEWLQFATEALARQIV